MVQTECIGEDGTPLASPYGGSATGMGLLSLREDGRLICVLCDSRQKMPAGQSGEYNSYCGSYQFDGKQLITWVDATANPAFHGTDQIRDITFENEVTVLRNNLLSQVNVKWPDLYAAAIHYASGSLIHCNTRWP